MLKNHGVSRSLVTMNHEQILKWQFCVVWYLPRTLRGIGQETAFNHIPDIKYVHRLFGNSHSILL